MSLLFKANPVRRFLLISAQSSFGNNMAYVALLILALERGQAAWAVTAILIAEVLPMTLLSAWFGNLADRVPVKRVLIGADLLRAAAFTGVAFSGGIWLTIAFVVAAGIGEAAYQPASKSGLLGISGTDSDKALGVLFTIYASMLMIGPAVGALLLAFTQAPTLMLINAATFVISSIALLGVHFNDNPSSQEGTFPTPKVPFVATLKEVITIPTFSLLLCLGVCITFIMSIMNVAEPLMAQVINATPSEYSLMVFAYGAGGALGAYLSKGNFNRLLLGMFGTGSFLLIISLGQSFLFVAPAMVPAGFFGGMLMVSDQKLLAVCAPERIRGSVFGLKDSLDAGAILFSFIFAGALATFVNARFLFIICGLLTFAMLLFVIFRKTRIPVEEMLAKASASTSHKEASSS